MTNFHPRFELPALPFERHSLEPEISRAQIDLLFSHYHRGHLEALNRSIAVDEPGSLATLAGSLGSPAVARHAGEAWNLVFFWHGLTPHGVPVPRELMTRVIRDFGDLANLQARWRARVTNGTGGWSWLGVERLGSARVERQSVAREGAQRLVLVESETGSAPRDIVPLLALSLSAEAYSVDFGEDRGRYFDALWPHLNWEIAALNLEIAPTSA
ncbi:Fe-Mn family superoxide dismutase [Salinicola rhizosphaerae]|uniref:Superoxide dismutase n=1 Tax=Salinicola rhizosphaerae TaxID=1443141 RepID=A0ABQ3DNM2_9GAMM|nr:Fe-Mn family superoxide dismutase [Salinicola rhizosphaerae]GHB09320.1 superoxide dismutase [Salinicola rhizosphaerae]